MEQITNLNCTKFLADTLFYPFWDNWPSGPWNTGPWVGIDIAWDVAETIATSLEHSDWLFYQYPPLGEHRD